MLKHLKYSTLISKYSRYFFLMVISFSLFSCIQTKKIAYITTSTVEKIEKKPLNYSYKIQVGDRFSIKVEDPLSKIELGESRIKINVSGGDNANLPIQQPTLNDYVVDKDGNIDLPLVGKIGITGILLDDLKDSLLIQYQGYISNPTIKVFMTNYNVTILGEVLIPGFYQVITNEPTFFDAISLSGGLTDFAERSEIQIIRKVEGKILTEFMDITNPSFISSPYFYMMPNDIIHVRPLRVKKISQGNALPLILSTITTLLTIFTIARTF